MKHIIIFLIFCILGIHAENFKWQKISDATDIALQGPGNYIEHITRDLYIVKSSDKNIYVYNRAKNATIKVGGSGKNFAVGNGVLYGLSPDKSGVYEYNVVENKWKRIGGATEEIYGFYSALYATNKKNEAYKYDKYSKKWSKVCDDAKMLARNNNRLYKISATDNKVYEEKDNTWTCIGGAAGQIYAGGINLYATNPQNGSLWHYKNGRWSEISSAAQKFVVCPKTGFLYRLDNVGVWYYNEAKNNWKKVGGPAGNLFVGSTTGYIGEDINTPNILYATNPQTHDLWCYSNN